MIISHRHRFIFLKTRKTAGTSVEIALSRICGDDDLITRISPDDEVLRRSYSGRGPQNDDHPVATPTEARGPRPGGSTKRPRFYNHMPAAGVRANIEPAVWDEYYKFSIERNPYDRIISYYYWDTRDRSPRPPIEEWIRTFPKLQNWPIYTIDDEIAVDDVLQYEDLANGLGHVSSRIGEPIVMPAVRAKSGVRSDRRPPSEVLSEAAVAIIQRSCHREILRFDYRLDS